MQLSGYDREEYVENPLAEVIFKIDFPLVPELSSKKNQPIIDYFNKIKKTFPEFAPVGESIPTSIMNKIKNIGLDSEVDYHPVFSFFNKGKDYKLVITQHSFVATTNNYKNFTSFLKMFENELKIFQTMFDPSYFNRIGLRYQNIIDFQTHNIDKNNITDFFEYTHEFQEDLGPSIKSTSKQYTYKLDEHTELNLVHALANKVDKKENEIGLGYLIDIDLYRYYQGGTQDLNQIKDDLKIFNGYNRNIFRSSIKEKLHEQLCGR